MSTWAWIFVFLVAMSPLAFMHTVLSTWAVRAARYAVKSGTRIGHALVLDGATVGFGFFVCFVSISLFSSAYGLPFLAIGLFVGTIGAAVGLASALAVWFKVRPSCLSALKP